MKTLNSRSISKARSVKTKWLQSFSNATILPKLGLFVNKALVNFQLMRSSVNSVDWKYSETMQQCGCKIERSGPSTPCCGSLKSWSFRGKSQGSREITWVTFCRLHLASWMAEVPPSPWPIDTSWERSIRSEWKFEMDSSLISAMLSIKFWSS